MYNVNLVIKKENCTYNEKMRIVNIIQSLSGLIDAVSYSLYDRELPVSTDDLCAYLYCESGVVPVSEDYVGSLNLLAEEHPDCIYFYASLNTTV